jgi:hypothetical protein
MVLAVKTQVVPMLDSVSKCVSYTQATLFQMKTQVGKLVYKQEKSSLGKSRLRFHNIKARNFGTRILGIKHFTLVAALRMIVNAVTIIITHVSTFTHVK